jgi:type II secretory pathway component PulM
MPRYQVQLSKSSKSFRIIDVEANDREQARKQALKEAREDDEEGKIEEWVDSLPGRRRVEWVEELD